MCLSRLKAIHPSLGDTLSVAGGTACTLMLPASNRKFTGLPVVEPVAPHPKHPSNSAVPSKDAAEFGAGDGNRTHV